VARRRNDAHIDLHGLFSAQRAHFPVLEDAEKLRLRLQAEIRDLVEQQGASVSLHEEALAVRLGARESAFHVAEELALDEAVGHAAAAENDVRAIVPRRGVVDRARQRAFSGARLALDQYR
jgi:hypothetical protein